MKRMASCFKTVFCIVVFQSVMVTHAFSQADMDVEIVSPTMPELIEKLATDLPTTCSVVPSNCTIETGTTDECGLIALKHLRLLITNCQISKAFREAIKLEFKLLKLIPVGKLTSTILDIADLTTKAMMADSPEALEADLLKYGIGKVVGDEMVNKLKKLTDIPAGEVGDLLGNLTKLFYKQMWDLVKKEIFPSDATWDCAPTTENCQANIHMEIVKAGGDAGKTIARFIFSANGDCHCKVSCSAGSAGPFLKDWNAHGSMNLVVDKTEVVEKGWWLTRRKVLRITLIAERPTYHVTANCCNSKSDSSSNISYTPPETANIAFNQVFAGLSLLREDSKPAFNLFGPTFMYTRFFNPMFGATASAGMHFGKMNDVNYTRFLLLLGVTLSPLQQYALGNKIHLFARALAGMTSVKSKYNMGSNSSSNTSSGFAAEIGAGVDVKLNNRLCVRPLQLDYQLTTMNGGVSNNLKLTAGVAVMLSK